MDEELFFGAKNLWHALHCIFTARYIHDGNTRDLTQPSSEFLIAGSHNEAAVLFDHANNVVICIVALVHVTGHAQEARILGKAQGDAVFFSKFLQLGHDTIENNGDALGVEAVHHAFDDIEFVANAVYSKK